MIYILTGDEGEVVSCWSTQEKADEENARKGNEHYIEEKEIDPPHTIIPEGYVKGLIYHVVIHKITGKIIKDDRSKEIIYRDPEYLNIYYYDRHYIHVYSAKNNAEEIAIQERKKWCEERTEVNAFKEINKNPDVSMIQVGDVLEKYDGEGLLDENKNWVTIVLSNNHDIHEAYDLVMKSPGRGTKRIRRGDTIILSN